MPTDKLNKPQSDHSNSSTKYQYEERGTAAKGINLDNLLPLDHISHSLDETEYDDHRRGRGYSSSDPDEDQLTAEIKTKVENTISRIRSESGMSESPSSTDSSSTDSVADSGRDDDDAPTLRETKGPTTSEPHHTPPGLNVKSIKAELEKRRTEMFAMVHNAEARAREAEEQCQQAELRLSEENEKRQLAEKQFHELMEEYQGQLVSFGAEESKRLEAEKALEKTEARLKEAEYWIKEAETSFNNETEARRLAEEAMAEAEERAEDATRSLSEIERKLAEAEARARAAEENTREMEAMIGEAEARARAAEENTRQIEAMIGEAEAVGKETTERLKAAEARAHQESEMKVLAEKKLKALEEELSSYLEVDWLKDEPDATPASFTPAQSETQESNLEYQEQIESERNARISAEKALAAAEAKVLEAEAEVRRTEEKHRQSEAGLKKIVRKQEAELRTLSEQVFRTKEPNVEMSSTRFDAEEVTQIIHQSLSKNARIRLVLYGAVIMLLLVLVYHLIAAIIQRM